MVIEVGIVVGVVGVAGWYMLQDFGSAEIGSDTVYRPGETGILARIFYGIFGSPRDMEKERAMLSTRARPVVPRTHHHHPHGHGFNGNGSCGQW